MSNETLVILHPLQPPAGVAPTGPNMALDSADKSTSWESFIGEDVVFVGFLGRVFRGGRVCCCWMFFLDFKFWMSDLEMIWR